MSRVVRTATATVLAALMVATTALAAPVIPGGVYNAGKQILIGVVGTHEIRAFNMTCHGKFWVARGVIGIHVATGAFSYQGTALLAKNGRVTKTSTSMSVSGVFKTSHLVTGHAAVGGCSTSFRAVYSYTR